MTIPYVNVEMNGEKIGELYFLRSDPASKACRFQLRSVGVMSMFISMCQGTFGNVELLDDENGNGGNVLIGTAWPWKDPATMSFAEKKNYMVMIARELSAKVGRGLAK